MEQIFNYLTDNILAIIAIIIAVASFVETMVYSISSTMETKFAVKDLVHSVDQIHKFILPWSHYQIIMREEDPLARSFYENEAYNQQWSARQLQRQVANIFAQQYALCLPDKTVLQQKLCEWYEEFKNLKEEA